MTRILYAVAAAAMAAAPAAAADYSAKPIAPAPDRFVARDILWTCAADGCRGATDQSRPAVLCQALAKRAGRLQSFAVDGRAFSSDQLDRCNAAAKDGDSPALANAR